MERLNSRRNTVLLLIVSATLLITYLHYSTLPHIHELHNVYAELYYLPILLGALVFGLKGALLTYAGISILYTPYIILNWTGDFSFAANKLSHAFFSGGIAFIAGFFVDREKKLRNQAEKDHYLASLGRAATAIVHDLRSPLIAIDGFAKRINEKKGDILEESKIILESSQRMHSIVNDVLDFARPINLELNQHDLRTIVQHAYKSCKAKAEEKEAGYFIDLPSDQLIISVDGQRIERAFVNLINNAIDASMIGGTVSITVKAEDKFLTVEIRDSGAGMDKETVENVFIPFYTKKSSGTGLGMAITKKIIEEHNGIILINSKEQIGTEIKVKLPL